MADKLSDSPLSSPTPETITEPAPPIKPRFHLPFIKLFRKETASAATEPSPAFSDPINLLVKSIHEQDDYFVFRAKKTTLLWLGALVLILGGLVLYLFFIGIYPSKY